MDEIIELGPRCRERYFCGVQFPGLPPQGIRVAGCSRIAGRYRVSQCLDDHLVEITLEGHGLAETSGQPQPLEGGTVLLVPAGHAFSLRSDRGAAWATAWAHLDPKRWPTFPAQPVRHAQVHVAPLAPLFALLDGERDRDDEAGAALRRTFTEALVLWLRRVVRGPVDVADRERGTLEALFERVRAAPAEDWSGPRLAALAGCSRSQLHRRCIAVFGRGPAAQVTRVRMQEAEYWLGSTALPLKLVADRLGYADAYHFSRAFKRWSALAPAHYRAARTRAG